MAQSLLEREAGVSHVSQSEQVTAELVAHAPEGGAPGRRVWVGLLLRHAPDWHTYWKNSGDSGLPTELNWTLPAGVMAGEIAWPTPRKFPIGNLANYGYDGTVLLPVPLTIDAGFRQAELDVGLEAMWLVCRKECIPGEAKLQLRIPAQGSTATHGELFDQTLAAVPAEEPAGAGHVRPLENAIAVSVEGLPQAWHGKRLEFFPELAGIIEPGAPWTQDWQGGRWTAEVPLTDQRVGEPELLPVVLALASDETPVPGTSKAGIRQMLPVQGLWPVAATTAGTSEVPAALQAALEANAARVVSDALTEASTSRLTLGAALLGALLGGLILNLMPCVFPVLAMKAASLAGHGGSGVARREGLAFGAGVLVTFLALAGLLIALKAAGSEIGWGFQLQSPPVVAGLALLMLAVALNLSGVFEVAGSLQNVGSGLAGKGGTAGAFFTGALAVVVAAPCTAPFMGPALGWALTQPAIAALVVFAALAIGFAAPFVAVAFAPGLLARLPKPGPWMDAFRKALAFPMYAAAAWLAWVLTQQAGADGLARLFAAAIVLALAAWLAGIAQRRAIVGARPLAQGLAAAVLVVIAVAAAVGPRYQLAEAGSSTASADYEPYTPERLGALQAEGKPVFVNYTAAWCVSCQVNEKVALSTKGVAEAMARNDVTYLKADWTKKDAVIAEELARFGRAGVPLYLVYGANGGPPHILPSILTEGAVVKALDAAAKPS